MSSASRIPVAEQRREVRTKISTLHRVEAAGRHGGQRGGGAAPTPSSISPTAASVKREDFGTDEVVDLLEENEVAGPADPGDAPPLGSGDASARGDDDDDGAARRRSESGRCAGRTAPPSPSMPESTPISTASANVEREEEDDADFFDFLQDDEVVERSPVVATSRNGGAENHSDGRDAASSLRRQHNITQNNARQSVGGRGSDDESAARAALETLLAADAAPFVSEDLKRKIAKIQELCEPRKVPCPAGYEEDVFYGLPEEMQLELSRSKPAQMQRETRRWKRRRRELERLDDRLAPGLHYHAPLPENAAASAFEADGGGDTSKRLAKQSTGEGGHVVEKHWNDRSTHRIPTKPIHYRPVPQCVSVIANQLKSELLRRFGGNGTETSGLLHDAQEVHPGYFRAHVSDDVSLRLKSLDFLPSHFEIKGSAAQKSIVFFNEKDGTCDCHFDRDSSALFLVEGKKEVKMAPRATTTSSGDGLFPELDPFSSDETMHGGLQWETVNMIPGSVLFIPQFWLHCVRSVGSPQTLALSFQVKFEGGTRSTARERGVPTTLGKSPAGPIGEEGEPRTESERKASAGRPIDGKRREQSMTGPIAERATGSILGKPAGPIAKRGRLQMEKEKKASADEPVEPAAKRGRPKMEDEAKASNGYGKKCTALADPARTTSDANAPGPRSKSQRPSRSPSPPRRKSSRQRFSCGVCSSNGFVRNGVKEEMWILVFQGRNLPPDLPYCPASVPKHLVCFRCCPRNRGTGGIVEPGEVITYPRGRRRRILTKKEFREGSETTEGRCFGQYAYVTGSDVDYSRGVVNGGRALFGRAGADYEPEIDLKDLYDV